MAATYLDPYGEPMYPPVRKGWPMDKPLPEHKHRPSFAPFTGMLQHSRSARRQWQLREWRAATGRVQPSRVFGSLMPPEQAQQVMTALNRKTLPLEV